MVATELQEIRMQREEHAAGLASSLHRLADPDFAPLFWEAERRGTHSTWWGHVPFAQWLTCAIEPRIFVELGTYRGVSYAAFCEAVRRENLATRCYAVDTWKGDRQTAFYDGSIYDEFREFHDTRYAAFSTLVRCSFDEALPRFADGSIDLLHVDGLHTYEAVRHDFDSWLPKMSRSGIVLFHDIGIHWPDYGVWQLWRELTEQYPHFEFQHSCGLGVLAVGPAVPPAVARLCSVDRTADGAVLRERFAFLADRWAAVEDAATALRDAELRMEAAQQDAEQRLIAAEHRAAAAEQQAAEATRQLHAVYASTSYRALGVLRRIGRRYPRLVRAVRLVTRLPRRNRGVQPR